MRDVSDVLALPGIAQKDAGPSPLLRDRCERRGQRRGKCELEKSAALHGDGEA
jgi:hypothetical protein